MQEIGNRAQEQGLTPKILEKVLTAQEPDQKPRLMAQLRQMKISTDPELFINHDSHL